MTILEKPPLLINYCKENEIPNVRSSRELQIIYHVNIKGKILLFVEVVLVNDSCLNKTCQINF